MMPRTAAALLFILSLAALPACGPGAPPAGEGEATAGSAAAPASEEAPAIEEEVDEAAYREEIRRWREAGEEELRQPDSWLTLAGLFPLEEGESTFGSAADNDLVFPAEAPAHMGAFRLEDGAVTVTVAPGVEVTHDGEAVTEMALAADTTGEPTLLEAGPLVFFVIERPGQILIRLRDRESPALAAFDGVETFPVDLAWRIVGRFEPYEPPKTLEIPNVLGTTFEQPCPGAVVFEAGGATHRLEPTGDPAQGLFLVFGDATNGHETYGGGRFLSIPPPDGEGRVLLDFNRAYNPPCVYTPYATCPLPPRQNRLALRIEAGQKMHGEGAHPTPGEPAS